MDWQSVYESWLNFTDLDRDVREDLHNVTDDTELEDRFYKDLEFGTAGMRGLIGAGTNRMNIYTVRKAAAGLARYIVESGEEAIVRGVVIAYDSRHKSDLFAKEAARTLGFFGIKVYLFDSLRTTPELSFAVRYLHAYSGIVITASHNPSRYNGFKIYGEDGAQYASEDADRIVYNVNAIDDELLIEVASYEALLADELLIIIGGTVDQAYLERIKNLIINKEVIESSRDHFKIVYTPLHGTGNIPVTKGLKEIGFTHVSVVEEERLPDGDFPTVNYPNPEERSAFKLAIDLAEEEGADLLLATDPDADRVGVAVKSDDGYTLLNGNEIGALLLHYLITEKAKNGTLRDDATVLKTIVTSELGRHIAAQHNLQTIDTLTGFKYIAEFMREFEETGHHSFLIGYEESYGYLIGDFVRDKDAVQTCLLIAEVAAYYSTHQMTLFDGLQAIYEEYGYFYEDLVSFTLEGKHGTEQMAQMINSFRTNPPTSFAGTDVTIREDYSVSERTLVHEAKTEVISLPKSNVLKYILEDGAWICIRPSGTEPKIKFYFGVQGKSHEESSTRLTDLKESVLENVSHFV